MANIKELIKNPNFVCKLIELTICAVNVALITDGVVIYSSTMSYIYALMIATGGYVLILSIGLMVYIMDKPNNMQEFLSILIGILLNAICGILQILTHGSFTSTIVVAVLMMVCAGVMIYDIYLISKNL